MAEQEIRPVDVQVARPVQAPNYVGMYSEAIKGALAPYEYLLNYQKELSEEDLRKAQIQNFLSEHDLKNKELSETIRSHTADEAMRNLQRQLESSKEDEFERHNLVDEAHQKSQEQTEAAREAEYERANKANELREADREKELERQNAFANLLATKKQDLETSLNDANIAKTKADTSYLQSEADRNKATSDDRDNDQKVIQEFTAWKKTIKPEDLYDSNDHPEIEDKIDDFASRIKTHDGRIQFDELHGGDTALGREIAERKELQKMAPEAKNVFQSTLIQSDKNKPYQVRFEQAMEAARPVNAQETERAKWSQPAMDAYTKAFAATKSRDQAFLAGRTVEEQYQHQLQSKAAPEKPNEKLMEFYQKAIPKLQGETEDHYNERAAQKAMELENLRLNDPVQYQQELQNLMKPGGGTTTGAPPNAADWLKNKGYIGRKAPGTSMISPAEQLTPTSVIPPADQQKTGSQLVQNTSPLLPETSDLAQQFHDYFGTQEEEGEPTTAPSALV